MSDLTIWSFQAYLLPGSLLFSCCKSMYLSLPWIGNCNCHWVFYAIPTSIPSTFLHGEISTMLIIMWTFKRREQSTWGLFFWRTLFFFALAVEMLSLIAFFASHDSCQQCWDCGSHVFIYALKTTHSQFTKTKEAVCLLSCLNMGFQYLFVYMVKI